MLFYDLLVLMGLIYLAYFMMFLKDCLKLYYKDDDKMIYYIYSLLSALFRAIYAVIYTVQLYYNFININYDDWVMFYAFYNGVMDIVEIRNSNISFKFNKSLYYHHFFNVLGGTINFLINDVHNCVPIITIWLLSSLYDMVFFSGKIWDKKKYQLIKNELFVFHFLCEIIFPLIHIFVIEGLYRYTLKGLITNIIILLHHIIMNVYVYDEGFRDLKKKYLSK